MRLLDRDHMRRPYLLACTCTNSENTIDRRPIDMNRGGDNKSIIVVHNPLVVGNDESKYKGKYIKY